MVIDSNTSCVFYICVIDIDPSAAMHVTKVNNAIDSLNFYHAYYYSRPTFMLANYCRNIYLVHRSGLKTIWYSNPNILLNCRIENIYCQLGGNHQLGAS